MPCHRSVSSRAFASGFFAILVVLVAFGLLLPGTVAAQSLTGALVGTVKDEQGGAVPGAIVRLSSPALIGGPATVITDDRGQLRFPVLPPGTYAIDVELAGFARWHEGDVVIGTSTTLERTMILKVQGIAQAVVVEGSGSRIEARSSGIESRFDEEYLRAIPSRRFSMFDSIRAAPGISPTSPSSGTNNTVSAFGSGGNENLFLIDGTNFTCPCAGVSRAEPSVDVIQEVQVQSVGVSAEYGNIQGTVFNVVTRQGSNRFQYDASYYGQSSSLTSQPIMRPVAGRSTPSGYERIRYRDFTTDLGGPIVRERLWFFTGYQHLRDYDSQPGADPALPRTYQQDKIFTKLTWRLKPSTQLMQSVHDEHWVNPDRSTAVTPFEATVRPTASVLAITFADLTHTFSSHTLLNARAGRFVYERSDEPNNGSTSTASHFDRVTGVTTGGPPSFGHLTLIRTTAKATLTHYWHGLFGADHDWKIGTQVERGEHWQPAIIPGGTRYVDNNGQPFQSISAAPSIGGGLFITAAAFATDAITVGTRLTINAGVRFDHSRAISQDFNGVDAAGQKTDDVIPGLGTLYTWNVLSPRLGATAKLTADGRTMLRASYGRFNQGVLTGEIGPVHPGVTPVTTRAFDPATGDYTRLVSVVDPKVNLLIDPATRTPKTDEYSIGIDRELGRHLYGAVAYIHKSGDDFIGWTDIAGQYQEQTRTLPNGQPLPVYVLTSPAADRRFLLTNPDEYSLTYNGLVLAVEKRYANRWQVRGSYTYSKAYGLQVSSGAAAGDPQVSTAAPAFPSAVAFGRDPNNLTNAFGRLPNDRPHAFRLTSAATVPWGISIAGNLQYFSGKPWAATTQISLPQGDQRILLETRGSHHLSSQTLLDLRVSKALPVGSRGRVELPLDVLNALNNTAEESLATDNLFSPNFAQPTVFVDPRRAMLSVRFNFGQ